MVIVPIYLFYPPRFEYRRSTECRTRSLLCPTISTLIGNADSNRLKISIMEPTFKHSLPTHKFVALSMLCCVNPDGRTGRGDHGYSIMLAGHQEILFYDLKPSDPNPCA